jgi:hypothetical protein
VQESEADICAKGPERWLEGPWRIISNVTHKRPFDENSSVFSALALTMTILQTDQDDLIDS